MVIHCCTCQLRGTFRGRGFKVFWNIYISMIMQSSIVQFYIYNFFTGLSFGMWNIYSKDTITSVRIAKICKCIWTRDILLWIKSLHLKHQEKTFFIISQPSRKYTVLNWMNLFSTFLNLGLTIKMVIYLWSIMRILILPCTHCND